MPSKSAIPVPPQFTAPDLDSLCRNWTNDASGNQIRMTNRALALRALKNMVNALAGKAARVVWSQAIPFTQRQQTSPTNYLYRWLFDDRVTNARLRDYRVLSVPRETDTGSAAYWARLDDSLAEDTDVVGPDHLEAAPGASPGPEMITEERATLARNNTPTPTEHEEGLNVYEGHTVIDVCVQEQPRTTLDYNVDEVVAGEPHAGDPCLANVAEEIRATLHALRTTNLPTVAAWCALGSGTSFATASDNTSGQNGCCSADTSNWRNLLDCAGAVYVPAATYAWTENTPGFLAFASNWGVGSLATTAGKKAKIQCRVLAKATTSSGTVKFAGPTENIASNTRDITVGTSLDWYGDINDVIYLDSSSGSGDYSGPGANTLPKIDVALKPGASGKLYVYGVACWLDV